MTSGEDLAAVGGDKLTRVRTTSTTGVGALQGMQRSVEASSSCFSKHVGCHCGRLSRA